MLKFSTLFLVFSFRILGFYVARKSKLGTSVKAINKENINVWYSFTGHRRRTTTTSPSPTTVIFSTINGEEPTEVYTTTEYVITTYPKLPKPLRLSSLVDKEYNDDVHNIDNIIDEATLGRGRHSKHDRITNKEVIQELDETSLSKSMNKVKKMYRDSAASAVNKLSGKGGKAGIFLTENCTTVIAQIGTTAILHCEVSDITENTVS